MVTKKTITEYDFKNIYEYFEYIVESKINGQKKQCKQLFSELSGKQRKDFELYMLDSTETSLFIDIFKFLGYGITQVENIYFDHWHNIPENINTIYENC